MKKTDAGEEKKRQIGLAQGKSYNKALAVMKARAAFAQKKIDDYLVSVACQEAEGEYKLQHDRTLKWQVPRAKENQHIEIAIQDRFNLCFIPHLKVFCKLLDSDGAPVGEKLHPFVWHPFFYHYGANWHIPKKGKYFTEISIKQPGFPRHDEFLGNRYGSDVIVRLGPLHLVPGCKSYGPE